MYGRQCIRSWSLTDTRSLSRESRRATAAASALIRQPRFARRPELGRAVPAATRRQQGSVAEPAGERSALATNGSSSCRTASNVGPRDPARRGRAGRASHELSGDHWRVVKGTRTGEPRDWANRREAGNTVGACWENGPSPHAAFRRINRHKLTSGARICAIEEDWLMRVFGFRSG